MSAMSELDAAGGQMLEPGQLVARHPFGAACDATPWHVAGYIRGRGVWRLREHRYGVFVDAHPREAIPLGRPDALVTAAAVAPLYEWDREALREFLELPAGVPCKGCGRPHQTRAAGAPRPPDVIGCLNRAYGCVRVPVHGSVYCADCGADQ